MAGCPRRPARRIGQQIPGSANRGSRCGGSGSGGLKSGAGNPTLTVLATLASVLRLSLEELLSPPRGGAQLFRKGSLPVLERGRGGVTVHKLLPHPIRGMEIDRLELAPGGRLTGTPHRPGTQEHLCCERGRLTLRVAGERFDLDPGDVAAFPGDHRHSYHNERRERAVGFSVVTLAPMSPEPT